MGIAPRGCESCLGQPGQPRTRRGCHLRTLSPLGRGIMDLSIRPTEPADRDGILGLVYEAFNFPEHDGGEEVGLVEDTWGRNAAIDGLELVALVDEALV